MMSSKIFWNILKHNGAVFISEFFALNLYISTALTNMHRWTHTSIKYYNIFTKPTIMRQQKTSTPIKLNTMVRIFMLIKINIFSQLNSPNQGIF